jgi:hypothetical protein
MTTAIIVLVALAVAVADTGGGGGGGSGGSGGCGGCGGGDTWAYARCISTLTDAAMVIDYVLILSAPSSFLVLSR